ncbi:astacin-like metalloprotease toxin 2 [Caerostris extrusa]|uniref:Metalloendopeptidase n=1 Tax=Caerostris extrusa TaxID=172846 RepID=A0AAV4SP48_CAEEX|nr:astacin-like metalloprotease toxin 2 [Caerostris extrusa]
MLFSIIISVITFLLKLFLRYRAPPILVGPVLDAEQRRIAHDAFYGNGNEMRIHPEHAGIKNTNYRWPGYPGGGTVPYVIDASVEHLRDAIMDAIKQYHDNTCIRFVERTDQENYISIKQLRGQRKGEKATTLLQNPLKKRKCEKYQGKQEVSLGEGCEPLGTIVHELGHALGLFHEHMRSDRDNWIVVHEENIIPKMLDQFNRTDADQEIISTPYDTHSIMHYGNYAFSKDPDNLMSMEALDGTELLEPYDKPGMTDNDIEMINKLYECQ